MHRSRRRRFSAAASRQTLTQPQSLAFLSAVLIQTRRTSPFSLSRFPTLLVRRDPDAPSDYPGQSMPTRSSHREHPFRSCHSTRPDWSPLFFPRLNIRNATSRAYENASTPLELPAISLRFAGPSDLSTISERDAEVRAHDVRPPPLYASRLKAYALNVACRSGGQVGRRIMADEPGSE
jgi:hypothetical protein